MIVILYLHYYYVIILTKYTVCSKYICIVCIDCKMWQLSQQDPRDSLQFVYNTKYVTFVYITILQRKTYLNSLILESWLLILLPVTENWWCCYKNIRSWSGSVQWHYLVTGWNWDHPSDTLTYCQPEHFYFSQELILSDSKYWKNKLRFDQKPWSMSIICNDINLFWK